MTQWVHRMPLDTGPNTRGAWSRFANLYNALSGDSYYATAYDRGRNRYWVLGALNSWPNGFGYLTPGGQVTVLANQGDNIAGDHVLAYLPNFDILVHFADCCSSSSGKTLSGKLLSDNSAFSKLNVAGSYPPSGARSGLEWSPSGGYFVSYYGGNIVYKLTPPSSNPLTGTWVWSTETLSGVNGASPLVANGPLNGQYSRFREVPGLSTAGNPTFIYADGRGKPVQLLPLSR